MNLGSESETVEFKKSTGEHKEALQAISAMLNKHGSGELYFGVKDDGNVIGQDVSDATLRQVTSWVSNKIEPAVFPTVEQLEAENGLHYIRVAFSGADAPYSADGRYFTRVGTSNKALSASELSAMVIKREHARSPWDSLPSGRPVSDADEQAVRDFVERGGRAGRVGSGFASVEDTLAKLDLIAPDGSLRNAAVELFCEGSDTYPRMKLGLLGGNTKAKILDLRRECGTMLKLLDFAEYFVTSNIRREFVIGETGMYRKEIPEIPAEAIREAVANALCHRDYTTGTAVEVNVFMDTVQIVSPGLFPEGDSPERHLAGIASEFGLRNPAIARTLFRAGVIEQYGTGIPRIKEACKAAGVRFRFEQTVNSTVVVFGRPGSQVTVAGDDHNSEGKTACATNDGSWGAMLDSLGKSERKAMELAAANGSVSTSVLAEGAQITKRASSAALKRLAERGLLEWVGKSARDPKQFYRIPSDDHPAS
ncbi:RNA-binding domain-containing protein [uncultured Senegalimassilia sp.]|uniref:RNA-binding domain-containing protein n=1 Tax=uncultured Senegalimassilia sp. TaxID=1714350 RepID=UPI0026710950|nr:RNA-binding domain-containing protein [uncultured Senegalimassilia sp.]